MEAQKSGGKSEKEKQREAALEIKEKELQRREALLNQRSSEPGVVQAPGGGAPVFTKNTDVALMMMAKQLEARYVFVCHLLIDHCRSKRPPFGRRSKNSRRRKLARPPWLKGYLLPPAQPLLWLRALDMYISCQLLRAGR